MKQYLKDLKVFVVCLSMFMLAGCGGSSSSTPVTPASVTIDATGKTSALVTTSSSDGSASLTLPQGTVLYADAAKTTLVPSGTLSVSVASISSVTALPVVAQSGIASVGILADISMMSGTTPVKSFSSPITVNVKLPAGYAAVGSSVDYFSVDSAGNWTKEGTATVKADGTIDMSVTHLSIWGSVEFNAPTVSFAGNYSGTYSGQQTGTWSMTVSENGAITVFDGPDTGTGSINTVSGAFTVTIPGSDNNGNVAVNLAGTISVSGAVTGTWTVVSGGQTYTGSISGTKTASFTTAMLSPFLGKPMNFVSNGGDGTTTTTITLNADGTITSPVIQNGTWSINASGQLVSTFTPIGHSTETDIATLTSVTATGFIASVTWTSVNDDSGTNTQTYTLM